MDYAIKIVEQSGRELTEYQVKVEITDPDFFSKCTDQRYVEFYDEDKQTLLSHYTELFDTANKIAIFWVKVPSIPANGTKMIYLNINTSRTEDLSDGEATFDFFDDFSGDSLDTSKWNLVKGTEGSNVFVQNSMLKVTSNTVLIQSKESFSQGYLIESKHKWVNPIKWGYIVHGFRETTSKNAEHLIHNVGNRLYADGNSIDGDFTPQGEVWYIYRLKAKDNTAKAEIYEILTDGSLELKSSLEGTTTFTSAVITLVERPASYESRITESYWDWVRVRKYTEPEPSVTVIRLGATPTYDLKLKIAQALAGEATTILDTDPKIRLLSGSNIIKELSLTAKTVYKDATNNRVVVAFLFVDDSSDEYTADNLELLFTKDNTEYVAFKSSKTFTKEADKRLPLRWEIYLNYDVDVCTYEESMVTCL